MNSPFKALRESLYTLRVFFSGKMADGPQKSLLKFSIFTGLIYFIQATGSQGGFPGQTLFFYCKEGLRFTPEDLATLYFWIGFAWLVKPLLGLISDFFPIMGYRRKSYIFLCNGLAVLSWFIMGYLAYTNQLVDFIHIVIPMSFIGLWFAMTDVAADGLTVQTGQETKRDGNLQSIQWGMINIGSLLIAITSTLVANWVMPDTGNEFFTLTQSVNNKLAVVFVFTALFPLTNIFTCHYLVREEKSVYSWKQIKETMRNIWNGVSNKGVWILVICIFGLHFSPGVGIPFSYYIRNYCGPEHGQMPKMWMAYYSSYGDVLTIIGIIIFNAVWLKINPKKWLYVTAVLGAFATIWQLWIDSIWDLVVITTFFGTISGAMHVCFMTIASRNTPKFAEGVIFAGYCSIMNVARSTSTLVGGKMHTQLSEGGAWYYITQKLQWLTDIGVSPYMKAVIPLMILSALFTLFTIPFITLLRLYKNDYTMMWGLEPLSEKTKGIFYIFVNIYLYLMLRLKYKRR